MTEEAYGKADCHWTYRKSKSEEDLRQGDIIPLSHDLRILLIKKYPGSESQINTHFLVLTQSCDLARRGSKPCNSPSILLAPVRALHTVIADRIERHQSWLEASAGVCRKSVKADLHQFLERLLNNNEPDYFYLHKDPDSGIVENSCAFIRLSIALDAEKDYEILRTSREVGLNDSFANKLGWHMGWMYARVGTEDWVPEHASASQFKKMIKNLLLEVGPEWVSDAKVQEASEFFSGESHSFCNLVSSPEEMKQFILSMPEQSLRDKVLDIISGVLSHKPIIDETGIASQVVSILSEDDRLGKLSDREVLLRNIQDHLERERLLVHDLLIDRIVVLLSHHAGFAKLKDKESLIAILRQKINVAPFLDNQSIVAKILGRIKNDTAFKNVMKREDT